MGTLQMPGPESPPRNGGVPPILWKIIIPAVSGGAVYLASNLTHQPQEWALMLSTFVGGVILVVQFLIDFDRGLQDVEKRLAMHAKTMDDTVQKAFLKINTATETYSTIEASPVGPDIGQLVQSATGLRNSPPEVALGLARSEISQVARFIRELGEGQANYEGEDQDWLLTLAREAKKSIDATSTTAVDGGGSTFDDGFWATALGQRYLGAQRDAASRGVTIRRLFIVTSPALTDDPEFQKIYRMQIEAHITVRILASSKIPTRRKPSQFDFILFDGLVCYEAIAATRFEPGDKPNIEKTQLITEPDHVKRRHALFEELWELGHAIDDVAGP
jgi:hypothetical protein